MSLEELRRALATLPDSASLTLSVRELRDVVKEPPRPPRPRGRPPKIPPPPPVIEAPVPALREPRFLRLHEVKQLTGVSRSWIYASMRQGNFPKSIQIGLKSVAWLSSDIHQWMTEMTERAARR